MTHAWTLATLLTLALLPAAAAFGPNAFADEAQDRDGLAADGPPDCAFLSIRPSTIPPIGFSETCFWYWVEWATSGP